MLSDDKVLTASLALQRSYIKLVYDWLCEFGEKPYLHAVAEYTNDPELIARSNPVEDINDLNVIVLNLAPGAVGSIDFLDEGIFVKLRFAGKPHECLIPYHSVLMLACPETGLYRPLLSVEQAREQHLLYHSDPVESEAPKRPKLSIVK